MGGLLDLVVHKRTGLLIPPGDPEALSMALRSLIDDPARAAAIGAAARAEVLTRYSFDRMIAAFEDLYVSGLHARLSARTRHAEAAGI